VTTAIQQHPTIPPGTSVQIPPVEWDRARRLALLTAGAGLALYVLLGVLLYVTNQITFPQQLFQSYLVGLLFWVGVGLGSLVLLMIQYMTGGAWAIMVRRILEAAAQTLPLLLLLFLPMFGTVALGDQSLYLWARPSVVQGNHELEHKAAFLNPAMYVGLTVLFFLLWYGLAFILIRWSRQQEDPARTDWRPPFQTLSAPGVILYALTISAATVLWGMSLEPFWFSTMYPVLFAIGQLANAMAFSVVVLMLLSHWPPLSEVVRYAHRRDLGKMLLTFVMLWAYMSVCQFILIWVENLPEEIPWYLRRCQGAWKIVLVLLFVFHFAVPFLLLLTRGIKENPRTLRAVALLLLVMRFVDVFWWIEPAYSHEGQYLFWLLDIAAWVGLGGIWVWWFLWQLKQQPLLPVHDPYFQEALEHEFHE